MTVEILVGDCLDVLRTLPSASAQCVVTSPPYYGLRSYLPAGHPDKAREIGTEDTPDAYVRRLVEVMREVRRVLRDDGVLWLNIGDSYVANRGMGHTGRHSSADAWGGNGMDKRAGCAATGLKPKDLLLIPARVALALQADGWWVRSEVVWNKPNPMPESVRDRPTCAHEKLFLLTKESSYFFDQEAIAEPAVGQNHHDLTGGRYQPPGQQPHTGSRKSLHGPTYARHRSSVPGGQDLRAEPKPTRNARNVQTWTPKPYRGAHFAVMPPDMAGWCIRAGTSERGQCPTCAAPWVRVVERKSADVMRTFYQGAGQHGADGRRLMADRPGGFVGAGAETIGWAPSCSCPSHEPVPQTVLDPFGGAGTVAVAAEALGRSAVLIDLDPRNEVLTRERLAALPRAPEPEPPLLAAMAAE